MAKVGKSIRVPEEFINNIPAEYNGNFSDFVNDALFFFVQHKEGVLEKIDDSLVSSEKNIQALTKKIKVDDLEKLISGLEGTAQTIVNSLSDLKETKKVTEELKGLHRTLKDGLIKKVSQYERYY